MNQRRGNFDIDTGKKIRKKILVRATSIILSLKQTLEGLGVGMQQIFSCYVQYC